MFIVGGIMALTIRAELFQPGLQIVQPELFNELTTLHGLIMLFGAFMPAFVGFANWQIPLMIGAPDMAFPRLNNFSFWLLPPAAILLVGSFFVPGGATGCGLDALSAAVGADGAGHGHGDLRHPHPGRVVDHRLHQHHHDDPQHARAGHDADEDADVRVDLARHRLYVDPRHAGTGGRGDDAVDRSPLRHALLQRRGRWRPGPVPAHLLVLRPPGGLHPDPAGVRHHLRGHSDVRPQAPVRLSLDGVRHVRDRDSSRCLVWAHHMFTVGMPVAGQLFFMYASLLVAVPTGVKVFNWIATMWEGSLSFETPMLFAVGFLFVFVVGGVTGVILAIAPVDIQLQDTYYVVAHFHYVMVAGSLFAMFAGTYYWLPKWTGHMYDETLGRWHFWLSMIFFNITFFPHALSRARRHAAPHSRLPAAVRGFQHDREHRGVRLRLQPVAVSVHGDQVHSRRSSRLRAQVWDGATGLEWTLPSPPPHHTFETPPVVA